MNNTTLTHSDGLMTRLGQIERKFTAGHPLLRGLLLQFPALLVLACVALASVAIGVPVGAFTRDPAAIADINPLNGMISHLGTVMWSITTGICLFTGLLLNRMNRRDVWPGFFRYFGLLTLVLLLDDLFLVHDEIVPATFSVGEIPMYGLYGTLLCYGVFRYWRQLLVHRFKLFAAAVAMFAVSVGFDVIMDVGGDWVFWIEDGAKLLGILNWCAFFTSVALFASLPADTREAR